MKSTALLPRAHTDGLVIKELPNETLVYDLKTDEAHCLNQTAALVWKRKVSSPLRFLDLSSC